MRPSGGHSFHGRTQPHTSTSGHDHTSMAPPHTSMLSQDGKEATGSKRCWTLGPRARQDKEAACSQPRVSPAASLQGVRIGLQGWSRPPAEVAGPWQPGLLRGALGGQGTLSSPRVVPGGNPRRGNTESPWTRDAASLPPVSWADRGTAEGIDALPQGQGELRASLKEHSGNLARLRLSPSGALPGAGGGARV